MSIRIIASQISCSAIRPETGPGLAGTRSSRPSSRGASPGRSTRASSTHPSSSTAGTPRGGGGDLRGGGGRQDGSSRYRRRPEVAVLTASRVVGVSSSTAGMPRGGGGRGSYPATLCRTPPRPRRDARIRTADPLLTVAGSWTHQMWDKLPMQIVTRNNVFVNMLPCSSWTHHMWDKPLDDSEGARELAAAAAAKTAATEEHAAQQGREAVAAAKELAATLRDALPHAPAAARKAKQARGEERAAGRCGEERQGCVVWESGRCCVQGESGSCCVERESGSCCVEWPLLLPAAACWAASLLSCCPVFSHLCRRESRAACFLRQVAQESLSPILTLSKETVDAFVLGYRDAVALHDTPAHSPAPDATPDSDAPHAHDQRRPHPAATASDAASGTSGPEWRSGSTAAPAVAARQPGPGPLEGASPVPPALAGFSPGPGTASAGARPAGPAQHQPPPPAPRPGMCAAADPAGSPAAAAPPAAAGAEDTPRGPGPSPAA